MSTSTAARPAVALKGNLVTSKRFNFDALVLAVTKDGKRGLIHSYGRDAEDKWMPLDWFTVTTSGACKCWKCDGSGLFYAGGAVVNGVYTGKTGPCFGCGGKGEQNDADRVRCHVYYRDHFRLTI